MFANRQSPRERARSRTREHDPELDAPRTARPLVAEPYFHEHQRLVANPFLALLALIPWFLGFREAFWSKQGTFMVPLLISLVGIACLLQFHCLDCGTTGVLFRWRRHVCERALARQFTNRRRSFRGPNPTTQTILWGYAILIAGFLTFVVSRAVGRW